MIYTPPSGTGIQVIFNESGYAAPAGTDIQVVFQNAYMEECEESLGVSISFFPVAVFQPFLAEEFGLSGVPDFFISFQPIADDTVDVACNTLTNLKGGDFIAEGLELEERIVSYIPSGIIQMLSNPFIVSVVPGETVKFTSVNAEPVLLSEDGPGEVDVTEILAPVRLEEVF